MLKSSCNQIKATLDSMTNNNEECDDDDFCSHRRGRGKNEEGLDGNEVVALQGQMTVMNNLLQSIVLSQVNVRSSSFQVVK